MAWQKKGMRCMYTPILKTGWRVALISANNAEDAGIRAEAIAAGLRQSYDLET
jgi:hypothetical protein